MSNVQFEAISIGVAWKSDIDIISHEAVIGRSVVGLNGFAVSEDVEFTGERRRRHCEVRSNLEYAKTRVVVRLLRTSQ